jgi:hypothetical protein
MCYSVKRSIYFYLVSTYIVAYLLKTRTVKSEKQPLLANGSETTFVSRQRLDKHVPATTDTHATIEVLLETEFSTRSLQRSYNKEIWSNRVRSDQIHMGALFQDRLAD